MKAFNSRLATVSAAYIAISIGAALAALVSYWPQLSLRNRMLGLGSLLVFGAAIMLAGSRAATVVSFVLVVMIGALWSRRSKAVLLAMAITLVVFATGIETFDKDMHRKNELAKASPYSMLNERYPLWHQALAAWRANPWFGVGMDNFDEIDQETVKGWVEKRGDTFDPAVLPGTPLRGPIQDGVIASVETSRERPNRRWRRSRSFNTSRRRRSRRRVTFVSARATAMPM